MDGITPPRSTGLQRKCLGTIVTQPILVVGVSLSISLEPGIPTDACTHIRVELAVHKVSLCLLACYVILLDCWAAALEHKSAHLSLIANERKCSLKETKRQL